MLAPGRRRSKRVVPVLLTFLLYFVSFTSAASAVLGIDIGTEYIKAALVKPGMPFEIVLSKDSKRKEASAVAFKPQKGDILPGTFPERSYGSDALNLAARFPGEVFPNLKHLLGVSVSNKAAKAYGARYPALELTTAEAGEGAAFKSSAFHKDESPFSVEELLAMELLNVKENAQSLAGKAHRVSSAVFAIPAFYTAEEKKALGVAAELAGLNILGMVTDAMAVGLHYATSRTFPSVSDGAQPEYHLVFDMGAGSTVATVLRMQERTIKEGRFNKSVQEVAVLGSGWDKTLGGDALNMLIVDDMITKFAETTVFKALGRSTSDVRSHGRAMARMLKDAEKARQVLSANKQTSTSFEGLFEDIDFRYRLSRDDFEQATSDFAQQIETPITQAMLAANLTFSDLTSVILHGGVTRTPFVLARLESLVGDTSKLRSNVNADEAAVMGAAFKAAQISPSFRVKDIVAGDAAGYATWLHYTLDGKGKSQKLFTSTSAIGVNKQITFRDVDDFNFKMFQARGVKDEHSSEPASYSYVTKNVAASVKQLMDKGCEKDNITSSWSVRLSPVNGLPEVTKATLSCVVEVPEKKGVVDGVKGIFGFGKNKDQEPIKEEASTSSASSSSGSSTASSETGKSTTLAKDSKVKKEEKLVLSPKAKTEIVKIEYTISCIDCKEFPEAEITRMKTRLAAFDGADQARRRREEDLNSLESFIYRSRDILEESEFIQYSKELERVTLGKLLEASSEWMYEGGQSATSEVLKAKLKELTDIVFPVQKRHREAGLRPDAIRAMEQSLEQTTTFANMIKISVEDAEKAKASASSAAEEAAKSLSTTSTTSPAKESTDPLDDLEEEIASLPVSAKDPSPTDTQNVEDLFNFYTLEDLKNIEALYTAGRAYLDEQLEKQKSLGITDDPAFDSKALESKAKQLNEDVMKIFERKMKWPGEKAKTSRTKGAKSSTNKTKKPKKSTSTSSSSAATSSVVADETVISEEPKGDKDEL